MKNALRENQQSISRRNLLKASIVMGGAASLSAIGGKAFAKSAVAQGFTTKEKFDTIIANGMVYTGEIKAPVKADIGIRNGKITAIAKLGKNCDNWVDATGRVVCPGFIDIHGHTDTNLLEAPLGDSKIHQGITTDIGGNCGYSPFPFPKAERKTFRECNKEH